MYTFGYLQFQLKLKSLFSDILIDCISIKNLNMIFQIEKTVW